MEINKLPFGGDERNSQFVSSVRNKRACVWAKPDQESPGTAHAREPRAVFVAVRASGGRSPPLHVALAWCGGFSSSWGFVGSVKGMIRGREHRAETTP